MEWVILIFKGDPSADRTLFCLEALGENSFPWLLQLLETSNIF